MKIAILGPECMVSHIGGGPIAILEIGKRLNKRHDVDIIVDHYNPSNLYEGFKELNVISLNPPFKSLPLLRRFVFANYWKNAKLSPYDACLSNTFYSNFSSLKNDNVYVCIRDMQLPIYGSQWSTKSGLNKILDVYGYLPLKNYEKIAVQRCRKVLSNSYYTKEKADEYYNVDSEVVYSGVACDEFYFNKFGDYCLFVGYLVPQKRPDIVIKAWKYVKDLKLYVVGPDNKKYTQYLKSIAPEDVIFLGEIYGEKLRELYANCFCVIFVPKEEGFGLVPLEAMASGKPVIGCDEGGVKETVIDNKTGFLIKPSPQSIAEKVNLLYEDQDLLKNIGRNARKRAREFDWNNSVKNLLKVIG